MQYWTVKNFGLAFSDALTSEESGFHLHLMRDLRFDYEKTHFEQAQ